MRAAGKISSQDADPSLCVSASAHLRRSVGLLMCVATFSTGCVPALVVLAARFPKVSTGAFCRIRVRVIVETTRHSAGTMCLKLAPWMFSGRTRVFQTRTLARTSICVRGGCAHDVTNKRARSME